MTQEKANKVVELLKNEEFALALSKTVEDEEAQALFAANGLEVTAEEVNEIALSFAIYNKGDDELDEELLETVAGGSLTVAAVLLWIAKTVGGALLAQITTYIVIWGVKKAEKKWKKDFNQDGKIG